MGKHETLPFKMTVERGKLVPATPYDAERLDTWRNGTAVNVTFIRDGGRVMERKWWAVLNRAVKECRTPWKTAAEASEAIKLAIGIVNLTKTVGGDFLAYPKSLTELDDPELDEAVQQMIDVVHHVTGVDPEEWKRQVAHIRDEPSPDAPSSASDESGGEAPSLPAATDQESGDTSGADDVDESDQAPAAPVEGAIRNLMQECLEKMLSVATDTAVPDPKDRRGNLERVKDAWKAELPDHLSFVKQCFEAADRVVKGGDQKGERQYLESLIGRAS